MAAALFFRHVQVVMLLSEKETKSENTNKNYLTALQVATDKEHYRCDGGTPQAWSLGEHDDKTWTRWPPPSSFTAAEERERQAPEETPISVASSKFDWDPFDSKKKKKSHQRVSI